MLGLRGSSPLPTSLCNKISCSRREEDYCNEPSGLEDFTMCALNAFALSPQHAPGPSPFPVPQQALCIPSCSLPISAPPLQSYSSATELTPTPNTSPSLLSTLHHLLPHLPLAPPLPRCPTPGELSSSSYLPPAFACLKAHACAPLPHPNPPIIYPISISTP